jgi:hypothetical protein
MILGSTQTSQLRKATNAAAVLPKETVDRLNTETVPYVLAKITDASAIPGTTNRWEYSWVIAEQLNNSTKTMQQRASEAWYFGTCYNACEGGNNGTTVGPGVLVANIPAGFSVKPVSGFVLLFPHRMTDGTERWIFCVPNAIDGTCT